MTVRSRYIVGVAPASPEADARLLIDSNTVFAARLPVNRSSPFPEAHSDLDMASGPKEVTDPGDGFPDPGGV